MLKTTLEQWRMFQAVARAGGFNQAAAVIHKSQSTIHHGVQKLEEVLDVKLFETVGRRVVLTPAGEVMLRRADYLLDEAARLEVLAGAMTEGIESELFIAVDHAFPYDLVYQAINRVSAEYPMVCIHLRESVLSGGNELLRQGEVSLAISPFPLSDTLNEELCAVRFIAVASPEHALHQREGELTFEDIKSHRQIVARDSARETSTSQGWLGAEQRWTVDHLRTSVDLVCRGLGIAWLPESLIQNEIDTGELKPLPLGDRSTRHVNFYLNFLDADRLGPAARSFLGELRYLTLAQPPFESIEQ